MHKVTQQSLIFLISFPMTNNDLIPRKEVEKMVEKMIIESEKTDIPSTPQFNNMKNFARYELRNLLQKISQIESVNGWIPSSIPPKLPASLVVASTVYPTMVIYFESIEQFHKQIPIRYFYLPPSL